MPDESIAVSKSTLSTMLEALPVLEMVELRATAVPAVALVGVIAPAVRSGCRGAVTVTVAALVPEPALFEHVRV